MPDIKPLNVCPECGKVTEYYPNPMYIHICEHCGSSCTEGSLIRAVDIDGIDETIKKLQDLRNALSHVQSGKLVKKN